MRQGRESNRGGMLSHVPLWDWILLWEPGDMYTLDFIPTKEEKSWDLEHLSTRTGGINFLWLLGHWAGGRGFWGILAFGIQAGKHWCVMTWTGNVMGLLHWISSFSHLRLPFLYPFLSSFFLCGPRDGICDKFQSYLLTFPGSLGEISCFIPIDEENEAY